MSIATIPSGFLCEYNGYQFDAEYTVTTDIRIRPVFDKAGRTVIYNEFSISLRTIIAGDLTSTAVTDARRRLTKSGCAFRYKGRGLGDLDINTSGTAGNIGGGVSTGSQMVRDVDFGPKCRELGVKLLGRRNAVQLDWQVTVCLPDCSAAKYAFAAMSLNFSVEFRLRKNGKTDRVVSGELMIPNNRVAPSSRMLNDSPDNYREQIVSPIPRGFMRTYDPFVLNEAKTSLKFGWTDAELDDSALPEGCVDAKFRQKTRSSAAGLITYISTFSGEYELAPGFPVEAAERAFFQAVRDRLMQIRRVVRVSPPPAPGESTFRGWIPQGFSIDEPNMYGPRIVQFEFTALIPQSSLDTILGESGIFRKDPKSDWQIWYNSLKDTAQHPRGSARMTFKANEDKIIDLCGFEPQSEADAKRDAKEHVLSGAVADSDSTWLYYRNNVYIEGDTGTSEMRTMPLDDLEGELIGASLIGSGSVGGTLRTARDIFDAAITNAGSYRPPPARAGGTLQPFGSLIPGPPSIGGGSSSSGTMPSGAPSDDQGFGVIGGNLEPEFTLDEPFPVQKRVRSSCYVIMHGSAMRAGLPVPCPELTKVEDIDPVPSNRVDRGEGFNTGVIGNGGKIPIFGAKWRLRYYLPETPMAPITPPPNPMQGA